MPEQSQQPLPGLLAHLAANPELAGRLAAAVAAAGEGAAGGRVVETHRGAVDVATTERTVRASAPSEVTTGDWVVVTGAPVPAVATVLPRSTAITRAQGEAAQVLAANVEEVWVTFPLDRPLSPGRVERSMVLAWESGASPRILATKADLAPAEDVAARVAELGSLAPGTAVRDVSVLTGSGVAELAAVLAPGMTAALIGASGSGKSSLLNALAGADVVEVGAVRASDAKGRHTTAWRELRLLASGAALIDTPGLRSVGVWVDAGGIDATFPEMSELAAGCRFADCAHDREPGCAVLAAVEDGRLDPGRLARWRKVIAEAAWVERRNDARAAAEQRKVWAARTREARPRRRR